MKLVKHENSKDLEYRADSLVYKVFFQETFHARVRFLVNTFLYILAGIWTLLPAVICWSILPCNTAPKHYNPSSSFVSTVNFLRGRTSKLTVCICFLVCNY